MVRFFNWLWTHGVLNNFVAGALVLLPIAITIGLMAWAVEQVRGLFGKGTPVGEFIRGFGERFVEHNTLAALMGWACVIVAVWLVGMLFRTFARHELEAIFNGLLNRIPIFRSIYKPVSQVVGLMKGSGEQDLAKMSVCTCTFGAGGSAGFLGLLANRETYRMGGQEMLLVYVPTSPVPMSGGLIFAPKDSVQIIPEMSVDDLMKVYLSLGVLTPQVMPATLRIPAAA
ncbi:MAG: hypothetical protein AMXMBFR7_05410 [Planctomycetota bacterium]